MAEDISSNREMVLAWQLIANTSTSVFLTGKAGTGKTTFLRRLRSQCPKRMVVLAPTGVAAINAEGQTIHSFFQLPFGPIVPGVEREARKSFRMSEEKKKLIRTLDLLVIDEISMVRCDLLDAIDTELRKLRNRGKPFGGVQLLLIGDLQQLAPVAKESEWQLLAPHYRMQYFFCSKALQQIAYVTIELKKVYRQQDAEFIGLLGKIRNNSVDVEVLNKLNARYIPDFVPPKDEDWIRLTTHNRMADEYNADMLKAIKEKEWVFKAEVAGNFPETSFPADKELVLKTGAQVMFVKNDPTGAHAYYNGKIGIIEGFDAEGISVYSKEDGQYTVVTPVEWENTRFVIDEETKEIREEVEGVFKQYPLRLAWAITVHKSQGLTFDHAVLDIFDSFAHGQAYVALSRCRTLEGMVLARPISQQSIITDYGVNAFIDNELGVSKNVEENLPQMMRDYFLALLHEAFSFDAVYSDLRYVHRVVGEHLYKQYPDFLQIVSDALPKIEKELMQVSARFSIQYHRMMAQSTNPDEDEVLQERVHSAAAYFADKATEIISPIINLCGLKIGNKQVEKQYNNAIEAFKLSYKTKVCILIYFTTEAFSVKTYLTAKAKAMLGEMENADRGTTKVQRKRKSITGKETKEIPKDTALFEELRKLRLQIAKEMEKPPFVVFSDKTLHALAAEKPVTPEDFMLVYGVGVTKVQQFAERFIEVIKEFK